MDTMSQRTNLFAIIIIAGILLAGCGGEVVSSQLPSNTYEEPSSKQEQTESPYLSTISKEKFENKYYNTNSSSFCWLTENELLVQGITRKNDNLESILSIANINTWQPNVIFEENNAGLLSDIIEIQDNIFATKSNGDYIVFNKDYSIAQKNYFDVPDSLAAIFNPINTTLYYYENGGMYAEGPLGKRLVYSLPSQWQESGYIRAVAPSASYESVAFSVILEPAYSVLTVVLDTKTDKHNEIDIKMNMPSYFWIGEELFAIENVDAAQSYCNIYYGENLSKVKVIDRNFLTQSLGLSILPEEAGDWGYIHYNTRPQNLGGNEFGIPLVADYSDEANKRASALLLLQKQKDEILISLLEHGGEMYSDFIVSPEGKKILFRKWGEKNISNAYYVLPIK